MSIFGSNDKKDELEEKFIFPVQNTIATNHTFISEDLEIKGNIIGKDFIELSGRVVGQIKSKKIDVRVRGKVQGEIIADTVSIEGEVDGEINAQDLYLRATSKIKGTIKYKNIDIQSGAIITAELIKII